MSPPSDSHGSELTQEQEQVAAAPADSHLLVLAGAGTGKTHTLVERLNHLVESEGVRPGSGILLLSFTRAAVGEIRDRLRAGSGEAAFVQTRTFDSFATRVLNKLEPNGAWVGKDFEGRIKAALQLDMRESLDDYNHFCVDEIQDLVGPRAELVKKILDEANCGFTLLGDPAQAIYNYLIDDNQQRPEGPEILIRWIKERFPQLEEHRLTGNHRARTEITRMVWDLWPRLVEDEPRWVLIREDLDDIFRTHAEVIGSDTDLREFATDPENRTAVLCRTNLDVLNQSASLRRLRIPHVVARAAAERCVPKWIAVLLRDEEHLVAKTRFKALHDQSSLEGLPPVEEAWRNLRAVAADGPNQIRLSNLAQKIARDFLPDSLSETASAPLVISTIHRSKGREFERVVLVDDQDFYNAAGRFEMAEETRILFVALSRARDEIWQKDPPPLPQNERRKKQQDRWTLVKGQGWLPTAVEIRPGDVDSQYPPGSDRAPDEDPVAIQRYLSDQVNVGDPVTLEFISGTTRGTPCVYYRITHDGQFIGITSERFGEDLASRLGAGNNNWTRRMRWPMKISGIHVDAVATMGSGSEAVTANAELGRSGLWLYPRVIGLGHLGRLEDWEEAPRVQRG